jgi:hypothetical protein
MEHRLDVEALRGHRVGDVFVCQLFERRCLARIVKTQNEDAELLLCLLELAQQRKQSHLVYTSLITSQLLVQQYILSQLHCTRQRPHFKADF